MIYVIWRVFAFFGVFEYFDQGCSFRLLFMRVDCDILLHYFLMIFHAYLQHSFLVRLPSYEFSYFFLCFLAVVWDVLMKFVAFCCILFWWGFRFHALLAVMRCLCEILCILLHNYRTRFPDEISCFWGPLQPLRMRFHAILAVVWDFGLDGVM